MQTLEKDGFTSSDKNVSCKRIQKKRNFLQMDNREVQ